MKFSEDQLRSLGYQEGADGSWSKATPASSDPTGRPHAEQPQGPTLEEQPQDQRPAIPRRLVIVTVRTVRTRDFDGLGAASKYYIDALIHLGIAEDDSPEFVEVIYDPQTCNHYEDEETTIEVWEIEEEWEEELGPSLLKD